jgi:hypothetical protein
LYLSPISALLNLFRVRISAFDILSKYRLIAGSSLSDKDRLSSDSDTSN